MDDEELKEERGADDDGMDVGSLFKQAIAIKEARNAAFRRKYDFWPSFYQHSLFSRDDIIAARESTDFSARLDFAARCKVKGNENFTAGDFVEAINEYERALSLFCWVQPLSANWRREEIEDDKLKECAYTAANDAEKVVLSKHMVSCYLNLAATYQKTKAWADSFEACNYAITLDPQNGRAYFRRAQARILPASSGRIGDEELLALCDMRMAHNLAPENQEVTRAYVSLSLAVDEHRKKERELYRRAFGKKATDDADAKKKPVVCKVEEKKADVKPATEVPVAPVTAPVTVPVSVPAPVPVPLPVPVPVPVSVSVPVPVPVTEKPKAEMEKKTDKENSKKDGEGGAAASGVGTNGTHTAAPGSSSSGNGAHAAAPGSSSSGNGGSSSSSGSSSSGNGGNGNSSGNGNGSSNSSNGNGSSSGSNGGSSTSSSTSNGNSNGGSSVLSSIGNTGGNKVNGKPALSARAASNKATIARATAAAAHPPGSAEALAAASAATSASIATLDEAMQRIKEVEVRAEQLRKSGRHADALILSEKAKTARAHIDAVYVQQAKAELLQRQLREAEDREKSMEGKGMRLRGNLFEADFINPSQAVLEDTKAQGLDLSDNRARRIMIELQKEARVSRDRSREWAKNGYPEDNPDGIDDFVARVIDKVYKEESKDLAGKLIDGLNRSVLLLMLKARRKIGPKVDMGDHTNYAMSSDAKHLAAVVIAAAGAGVLPGLREYEKLIAAGPDGVYKLKPVKRASKGAKGKDEDKDRPKGKSFFVPGPAVELTPSEGDALSEDELEDMSKEQLRVLIIPFLAGDLFAIWRQTDLSAEREKNRLRRMLSMTTPEEDDLPPPSEEELAESALLASMTSDERAEYDKGKREQVVYTMLQDKYGLDEDQIYSEEDKRRLQSATLLNKINSPQGNGFPDPIYMYIVGVLAVLCYFLFRSFTTPKGGESVDISGAAASAYAASG